MLNTRDKQLFNQASFIEASLNYKKALSVLKNSQFDLDQLLDQQQFIQVLEKLLLISCENDDILNAEFILEFASKYKLKLNLNLTHLSAKENHEAQHCLFFAFKNENVKLIVMLLTAGETLFFPEKISVEFIKNMIMEALKFDKTGHVLQQILTRAAQKNMIISPDFLFDEALSAACKIDSTESISAIYRYCQSMKLPNLTKKYEDSLTVAIANQSAFSVELLAKNGAYLSTLHSKNSEFDECLHDPETLSALAKHGAFAFDFSWEYIEVAERISAVNANSDIAIKQEKYALALIYLMLGTYCQSRKNTNDSIPSQDTINQINKLADKLKPVCLYSVLHGHALDIQNKNFDDVKKTAGEIFPALMSISPVESLLIQIEKNLIENYQHRFRNENLKQLPLNQYEFGLIYYDLGLYENSLKHFENCDDARGLHKAGCMYLIGDHSQKNINLAATFILSAAKLDSQISIQALENEAVKHKRYAEAQYKIGQFYIEKYKLDTSKKENRDTAITWLSVAKGNGRVEAIRLYFATQCEDDISFSVVKSAALEGSEEAQLAIEKSKKPWAKLFVVQNLFKPTNPYVAAKTLDLVLDLVNQNYAPADKWINEKFSQPINIPTESESIYKNILINIAKQDLNETRMLINFLDEKNLHQEIAKYVFNQPIREWNKAFAFSLIKREEIRKYINADTIKNFVTANRDLIKNDLVFILQLCKEDSEFRYQLRPLLANLQADILYEHYKTMDKDDYLSIHLPEIVKNTADIVIKPIYFMSACYLYAIKGSNDNAVPFNKETNDLFVSQIAKSLRANKPTSAYIMTAWNNTAKITSLYQRLVTFLEIVATEIQRHTFSFFKNLSASKDFVASFKSKGEKNSIAEILLQLHETVNQHCRDNKSDDNKKLLTALGFVAKQLLDQWSLNYKNSYQSLNKNTV
ncbi:MAG: hypothetical protein ACD_46C00260G0004 [uncultured bacterium]|nr:MAG: hypothetical protein ACD_46C00260G0004 [uncultured bacterium]